MKEFDLQHGTKLFALRIIKLFTSLPKSTEAQVIGKQILRSGTSVGAQYRKRVVQGRILSLLVRFRAVYKSLTKPHIGWNYLSKLE